MDYSLVTLEPGSKEFPLYLTLAHRWMADRAWAYAQSGGYTMLQAYLDQAKQKKNVGVFVDGEMVSLVTVEKEPDNVYLLHVTSPKRSHLPLIISSTYTVGWQVFDKLEATKIYTMSPIWKGRKAHKGSIALCLGCGLRQTGYTETDAYGTIWNEYAMDREDWLANHHG